MKDPSVTLNERISSLRKEETNILPPYIDIPSGQSRLSCDIVMSVCSPSTGS